MAEPVNCTDSVLDPTITYEPPDAREIGVEETVRGGPPGDKVCEAIT